MCQTGSNKTTEVCQSQNFDPGLAGIFSTYPSSNEITTLQCFLDQIFGTFLLVLLALAVIDTRNFNTPKFFIPFILGIVVSGIVSAFEYNCGAALNPARDLGPRLFTAIAGWGSYPFSYRSNHWWLVPIFGPHLGALLACFVYNFVIEFHWPADEQKPGFGQEDLRCCKCCKPGTGSVKSTENQ